MALVLLAGPTAFGQEPSSYAAVSAKEAVQRYVDHAHNSPYSARQYTEWGLVEAYGSALIPLLEPLMADEAVRAGAHNMLVRIATGRSAPEGRTLAVSLLVRCAVNEPRYSPPGPWYADLVSADFTKKSKRLLRDALGEIAPDKQLEQTPTIMLAGASGEAASLARLRYLDSNRPALGSGFSPLQWRHALRASARLGDKHAIAECIRIMDSLPAEEERARNLDVLGYVRQDVVVEYILRYLFSDEKEPSRGVDAPGVAFSTRARSALRSMLLDFPDKASLDEQRKWAREQKKWKIRR